MEKINVAELLKDCPKGTELYSPLCGRCVFDRLNMGTIICKKQNTQEITFTSEGYYMLPAFNDCECVLFPSKDQRDWSKFQRPFKDGDILSYQFSGFENRSIYIYMYHRRMNTTYYVAVSGGPDSEFMINNKEGHALNSYNDTVRFATEEEKQKLFDAIKANGYKWNAETKNLEKLIEPIFKVGDRIRHKEKTRWACTISRVEDRYYVDGHPICFTLPFVKQKDYELVPNKFDITTLKPFDKVLVRDNNEQKWTVDLFSFYDKDLVYKYVCVGHYVNQCVPYEDNEHLLGTTDDCDEYYKTWE